MDKKKLYKLCSFFFIFDKTKKKRNEYTTDFGFFERVAGK